jgi:tRNA pseudouridine32 synthase/23S rRNA pseudouridine746 synthase
MLTPDVAASVTYFDPQPVRLELPARLPSPFVAGTPHPLAVRAAHQLRAELDGGLAEKLGLARDGKMFGVLVVEDAQHRIGFLRAFSGMVAGDWTVPGFVCPAFDRAARDGFWIAGEQELIGLANRIAQLEDDCVPTRAELASVIALHAEATSARRGRHRAAKADRHAQRATTTDPAALATLDRLSIADTNERQRVDRAQRHIEDQVRTKLRELESLRDTVVAERAAKSRDFLVRIHATYGLANVRGDIVPLRALFEPAEPPGGAGDCAAPKLLAHAYRERLQPIALAEFWCGAPPPTGDRREGEFYPACRGKCGPILAHMLTGLGADPPPRFGEDVVDPAAPWTIFEDAWLAVITKPVGLLSVPGRSSQADSVLARLRRRYPDATGPLLPHRLDLDTSGIMLVAKDLATHGALQRQFSEHTIAKRYVAILDGEPRTDGGSIDLPLRLDVDDRPRQVVDTIHGKPALTEWRVLARVSGRTRVALYPKTGRAHQLRVHAAQGIGVAIVGDRLYGRPADRLLLHAEAIELVHPHTRERLSFEQSAPF